MVAACGVLRLADDAMVRQCGVIMRMVMPSWRGRREGTAECCPPPPPDLLARPSRPVVRAGRLPKR